MHLNGGKSIRDLLVTPKDKDNIFHKSEVIYRYRCSRVDCEDEHIGKSDRTFAEIFKEPLRSPSPIYDHYKMTGHTTRVDSFSIVGREKQNLARSIK